MLHGWKKNLEFLIIEKLLEMGKNFRILDNRKVVRNSRFVVENKVFTHFRDSEKCIGIIGCQSKVVKNTNHQKIKDCQKIYRQPEIRFPTSFGIHKNGRWYYQSSLNGCWKHQLPINIVKKFRWLIKLLDVFSYFYLFMVKFVFFF